MSKGIFEVVTDGRKFRIINRRFGGEERFVGLPEPLDFETKEAAENYIHNHLSMLGWKKA